MNENMPVVQWEEFPLMQGSFKNMKIMTPPSWDPTGQGRRYYFDGTEVPEELAKYPGGVKPK